MLFLSTCSHSHCQQFVCNQSGYLCLNTLPWLISFGVLAIRQVIVNDEFGTNQLMLASEESKLIVNQKRRKKNVYLEQKAHFLMIKKC